MIPCLMASAQEVTIADLKKYIIAMDSIETLKNQLSATIANLSKGNNKISSQRYAELVPIINDQAKLTEFKATSDEIAFVKKAQSTQREESRKFQKNSQSIISDYVGEAVFNKIRNSLRTDVDLKRQYDSLTAKPIRP